MEHDWHGNFGVYHYRSDFRSLLRYQSLGIQYRWRFIGFWCCEISGGHTSCNTCHTNIGFAKFVSDINRLDGSSKWRLSYHWVQSLLQEINWYHLHIAGDNKFKHTLGDTIEHQQPRHRLQLCSRSNQRCRHKSKITSSDCPSIRCPRCANDSIQTSCQWYYDLNRLECSHLHWLLSSCWLQTVLEWRWNRCNLVNTYLWHSLSINPSKYNQFRTNPRAIIHLYSLCLQCFRRIS